MCTRDHIQAGAGVVVHELGAPQSAAGIHRVAPSGYVSPHTSSVAPSHRHVTAAASAAVHVGHGDELAPLDAELVGPSHASRTPKPTMAARGARMGASVRALGWGCLVCFV